MPSSSKEEKIMTDLQRLKDKLIQLRLKTMAQNLEITLKEASEKNRDTLFVINHLLHLEAEHRWHNAIKLRFQQSKLNEKLTIDQFDFNHHKSRKDQKTHILNLLNLNFVKELKDVIFIGNPGTGKTFLAKCIAYAAFRHRGSPVTESLKRVHSGTVPYSQLCHQNCSNRSRFALQIGHTPGGLSRAQR